MARFANWLNRKVLETLVRASAATAAAAAAPAYAAPTMTATGSLTPKTYEVTITNTSPAGDGNNMIRVSTPAGYNQGVDANYCGSDIGWYPDVKENETVWTQFPKDPNYPIVDPLSPGSQASFVTNYDPNLVPGQGDVTAESDSNGPFNTVKVTAPRRPTNAIVLWNPMGDYTVSPDTPNYVDPNNPDNRIVTVQGGPGQA